MAFDRRETALLVAGDFFILAASLFAALFLRSFTLPSAEYFEANFVPFLPLFLLSILIFYIAGLYEKQTRPIRRIMSIRIAGAQAATVAISALLFFVLPLSIAPKTILILYLIVSVVAISAWRFYRMDVELASGKRTPALLIGSGSAVRELYEEVNHNARFLISFVKHIETKHATPEEITEKLTKAIGDGARLIVIDTRDDVLWNAVTKVYGRRTYDAVFTDLTSMYEEVFDRVSLEHEDARELIESASHRHLWYDASKRAFDLLLAAFVSVIALPFIALGALLMSTTGGTPFITSPRIGKNGRTFRMVKLRTMLFDDQGDPDLQKVNRVTPVGRMLRRSRVDELPQLWNVIRGDVSFIGPRPELPKIAEVYEEKIPLYSLRHLIPPGLSGWAQIHDYDPPKGAADIDRTTRKLSFDLYYLKHRSLGLDLAIAAKTLRTLAVFVGK